MTECLWLWGRWGILKVEGANDTYYSPGQKHSKVQDAHLKPIKKIGLISLHNKEPNSAVGIKYTKLKRQPATDSFPAEKKRHQKGGALATRGFKMQLNKATAPRSGAGANFIVYLNKGPHKHTPICFTTLNTYSHSQGKHHSTMANFSFCSNTRPKESTFPSTLALVAQVVT